MKELQQVHPEPKEWPLCDLGRNGAQAVRMWTGARASGSPRVIGGCEETFLGRLCVVTCPSSPPAPPGGGGLGSVSCRGSGQPEHSQDISQLRTLSNTKTIREGSRHRAQLLGRTGGHSSAH